MKKPSNEHTAWRISMDLGRQSFQSGRHGDAVNAFQQATTLQPDRVEGWVNLGSALLESGRFKPAVAALGKVTELQPTLGIGHMLLGDAFRQLGEMKVALRSYRTAVALQRSPLALNKLACALRTDGQGAEAATLYREAIDLDPDFSLARVNLATLRIEAGDFDGAAAMLVALEDAALPAPEREEALSSQRALSEYFRLRDAIAALPADRAPLRAALGQSSARVPGVDEAALDKARRYLRWAASLDADASEMAGSPPPPWPMIEALFMIPLIDTPEQYLGIRARLDGGETPVGDLAESLAMEAAIEAARACHQDMADPVLAELHLRHWHALACRDIDGFMPGHFKYTQNWSTRYPTRRRVDPARASGTFRQFAQELYATLAPGLPRAAVAFMGLLDLHPFADGNGRVAMTWLNRELEWAGLMPALFRRDLALAGEALMRMDAARGNDGDLGALLDVIRGAQAYAVAFCTELPDT